MRTQNYVFKKTGVTSGYFFKKIKSFGGMPWHFRHFYVTIIVNLQRISKISVVKLMNLMDKDEFKKWNTRKLFLIFFSLNLLKFFIKFSLFINVLPLYAKTKFKSSGRLNTVKSAYSDRRFG